MAEDGAPAVAGHGLGPFDELEKMMAELVLREENLDDIIYDEDSTPPEAARWSAVMRVHIDKPYSQFWFFKNM